MDSNKFEMRYYATYYYANIIENVLSDQFSYLRKLNEFYGDGNCEYLVAPFQKHSVFHQFINFIVEALFFESMPEDSNTKKLHIKDAFDYYEIKYTKYHEWIQERNFESNMNLEYYDYYCELLINGDIESLLKRICDEVFYIMFLNRATLRRFNDMIASIVSKLKVSEIQEESNLVYFKKDGVLRRVNIPEWVKKAVYYRDRGRCVICNKDLSGALSFQNKQNYDHILPLAIGGLNDVTNIQLLCEECNKNKLHYSTETSITYERWY